MAFENLEIWWVTGAQLLYGGDAVVKVDAHSKEMVEGLNASGRLPIKVVYKGTANSSKEVQDVMRAANNDAAAQQDHHMDAHLLARQDVDTRAPGAPQAPAAPAHPV